LQASPNLVVRGLPQNVYVSSVLHAGEEVPDTGIRISGLPPEPVEIVLEGPGGRVEGLVVDANEDPVVDALVVVVPSPDRRSNTNLFRTQTTDQRGAFSIGGVVPGEYTILAWTDVAPGAYQNEDFLRRFATRGTRVRIDANDREIVEVSVQPD